MRKSRKATNIAISLGLLAVVAGCGSSESHTASPVDNVSSFEKKISWGACKGADAPAEPFECGSVTVPLDYRDAQGKTIKIALIRLPASEGKAKGIILTNPGGPGASGFDLVANAGQRFVSKLGLEAFDFVGFDPRGVDRSNGLRCWNDKDQDTFTYYDDTPDTPEEKKIFKQADAFDNACTNKNGASIVHYSTEFTARDMDLIRAGMGFEKLNYLGISYGTYLGGIYATLFPTRVETMLLDGAFDPAGDTVEQQYTTQAIGFEKAFNNWVKWCESATNKCAFASSDVKKDWNALYKQMDKTSIFTTDGRDVNHNVLDTGTKAALYSQSEWFQLGEALAAAKNGNGEKILAMADSYNRRSEDGTYNSENDANYIIRCASGFDNEVPNNPKEILKTLQEKAPWYSQGTTVESIAEPSCDKSFGKPKLLNINFKGTAPIVVVGGKNDPATPFRWSEEMTVDMGEKAVLVASTGEGHSQILVERCVDEIAKKLFTKKVLPKKGTACKPDVPVAQPSWWSQATAGVSGTEVNRDLGNSYFGLEAVDAFAEYRAIPGSETVAYRRVSQALSANGYTWSKSDNSNPATDPQFFVASNGNDYVGVFLETPANLAENKMYEPQGSVPKGTTVVALYYWPPSK